MLIYYQNVIGLNVKTEIFDAATCSSEYHIIASTETWLSRDEYNNELFSYKNAIIRDAKEVETTHIKRSGDFSRIKDVMPWINILGCNGKINVLVFYIIIVYITLSITSNTCELFFEYL